MILYNDNDANAAAWLRELVMAGELPRGEVTDCGIEDIGHDHAGRAVQFHAFAGIGGWSLALRLAGVPEDYPLWTGSCPCQPFSSAGKQAGFDDSRHLWPAWRCLIAKCRPPVILGEQVASRLGREWLAAVRVDLEALGYAVGAADLCAAGVGAPHIRQRLWWVAKRLDHAESDGRIERRAESGQRSVGERRSDGRLADAGGQRREGIDAQLLAGRPRPPGAEAAGNGEAGRLADADDARSQGCDRDDVDSGGRKETARHPRSRSTAGRLADAASPDWTGRPDSVGGNGGTGSGTQGLGQQAGPDGLGRTVASAIHGGSGRKIFRPSPADDFWRDADWLFCRDGRWRPVEPGTFPLVARLSEGVGYVCADCREIYEGIKDDEDVRALRQVIVEAPRRVASKVLQHGVPVGGLYQDADDGGSWPLSGAAPVRSDGMRGVRCDGAEAAPAPQEPRRDRQQPGEHRDPLQGLSREGAQEAACLVCERTFLSNRIVRLRGYGNAIVPQVAAVFIRAALG